MFLLGPDFSSQVKSSGLNSHSLHVLLRKTVSFWCKEPVLILGTPEKAELVDD